MPSVVPPNIAKEESALSTQPCSTDVDGLTQVKQAAQNKIRNLEKRRGKLEGYKQILQSGNLLTPEQQAAYSQLNSVEASIETLNEMLKSIGSIQNERVKQQRIQRKKEERDRQQAVISKLRELLQYQDILNSLGNEVVRKDFTEGSNGAVKCSKEDLALFDDLYKNMCPSSDDYTDWSKALEESATFSYHLINGTSKPVSGCDSTTFAQLKERLDKVSTCPYFVSKPTAGSNEELQAVESTVSIQEPTPTPEPVVQTDAVSSYDTLANISMDHPSVEQPILTNGTGGLPAMQQTHDLPQPPLFLQMSEPLQPRSPVPPMPSLSFIQDDQTGVSHHFSPNPPFTSGQSIPPVAESQQAWQSVETYASKSFSDLTASNSSVQQTTGDPLQQFNTVVDSHEGAENAKYNTYAQRSSNDLDQQYNTAGRSDVQQVAQNQHQDSESHNHSSDFHERGNEQRFSSRGSRRGGGGGFRGGYNNGFYRGGDRNGDRSADSGGEFRGGRGGGYRGTGGDGSGYRNGDGFERRGGGGGSFGGRGSRGGTGGGFRGGRGRGSSGGGGGGSFRGGSRGGYGGFNANNPAGQAAAYT